MKWQNKRAFAGISARIAVIALLLVNFGVAHLLARQIHLKASSVAPVVKDDRAVAHDAGLVPEGAAVAPLPVRTDSTPFITAYTVQEGDTLSGIADKFHVSTNTIRFANSLAPKSKIRVGQTLTILPVTGIQYTVARGDTVEAIARKFGADAGDILAFNDIDAGTIKPGMKLVIPDAELQPTASSHSVSAPKKLKKSAQVSNEQEKETDVPVENVAPSGTASATDVPVNDMTRPPAPEPAPEGYYAVPILGSVLTQGLHGYNGVDFGAPIGSDVRAAAAGTVIVAKDGGYNGGYGKYVVLSHANGSQTLYAHLSKVVVSAGDTVTQGQTIARSGMTGRATGPHLHFEVRGATNPWASDHVGTEY